MKLRASLLGIALVLVACGGVVPAADTSTPIEPSTTGVSSAPPTTTNRNEGVRVRVTATPVQQPDGSIELCPPGMTGVCPGIILEGELAPELLATESKTTVVEVTGSYDGRRLIPESDPVAVDYLTMAESDFTSLCPDLHGTASINPSNQLEAAIGAYVASAPDYAATWWDRESSVLTVWFSSDDVSVHQQAISELAGDEPVCVAGGARYSEAELLEASQLLNEIRDTRGLPIATFGYGVGGLSNRIDLPLEELDTGTRSTIADLVGDRVVPYPYIEMMDAPLAELPDPVLAVDGDVDILTSRVRVGGGMDALGRFKVQYDTELNCVYFAESPDADRTVPVWPFGYAATSDPMTVYDYDGQEVVSAGETIELGGGGVEAGFVEGNTCGADRAWIVNR